jgi:hypothetical protein
MKHILFLSLSIFSISQNIHAADCNMLHQAVLTQNPKNVERALRVCASTQDPAMQIENLIKQPDCAGNTPMHVAMAQGNLAICEMLLKHFDGHTYPCTNLINKAGEFPLECAARCGNIEAMKLYMQHDKDCEYVHVLFNAAKRNNVRVLKALVSAGVSDMNIHLKKHTKAPLKYQINHQTLMSYQTPIFYAVAYNCVHAVEFLLSQGAHVDRPAHPDVRDTEMTELCCPGGRDNTKLWLLTPLDIAEHYRYQRIEWLLQQARPIQPRAESPQSISLLRFDSGESIESLTNGSGSVGPTCVTPRSSSTSSLPERQLSYSPQKFHLEAK